MKNNIIIFLLSTCFVFLQVACSGNFFKDMSKSTSDEALFEDARKAIDNSDWATAIDIIENQMSATARARTDVIQMWAGSYAGKCGQNFIALVDGMSNSSGAPFLFFMQSFQSISVSSADCYKAQQKMELIGNSSQRTTDQNLFMFFLGISKIGTYLKSNADLSPVDGAADAGFDACDHTKISDTDVAQVITGLGLIFDNLTSVGSSISGSSAVSAMNAFKSTCGTLTGVPNCAITDPTSSVIDANVLAIFRQMIATSDFGVQTTCTTSQILPTTGVSPCCPAGVH